MRRLTPTEKLKNEISFLQKRCYELEARCAVLSAENVLYKEFNNLHFKQGITSLVKALRVSIWALSNKERR